MNELERLCIHCKKNLLSNTDVRAGKKLCKSCANKIDNKINKIKSTRKTRGKEIRNPLVDEQIDPIIEGRLRFDDFGNPTTTMGTAWGIRKKKISKKELLKLKNKYEPERYKNDSEDT